VITPIRIKVNVCGDVVDALTWLQGTHGPAISRRMWFAEARIADAGGPPALLDSGIIIRLRSGDCDDVTVMLRPCRHTQLGGRWSAPFTEGTLAYRLEDDWADRRRMLTASATSCRPPGSLRDTTAPGGDVVAALDSAQRQFLVSCTPPGAAVEHLVPLGPVLSTKWVRLQLGELQIDAERWSTDGLDIVELSSRIIPHDGESLAAVENRAAAALHTLETAVRRHGLHIVAGQTKTQQVITTLAARGTQP
jgi:hypothetical protein